MCLYDPPLLLGQPDLSAVAICSLPLAASSTNWRELVSAWVGLTVAFLATHFFIVAIVHEAPPSTFYWIRMQTEAIPIGLYNVAFALAFFYAASQAVRNLWRGAYRRALLWFAPVLVVVGTVAGIIAYAVFVAHAAELAQPQPLVTDLPSAEDMVPFDCMSPPFGEGTTGYTMLAALVLFEILVAVALADAINRRLAR